MRRLSGLIIISLLSLVLLGADSYKSYAAQIKLIAGKVEVIVNLNDSQAAKDLVTMLPLTLTLIEHNEFAKGMTLPRELETDEPTTRKYSIGEFGYWNMGPEIAIFYDDIYEQTIVPVIPLGKAESGAEKLSGASGEIRLELVRP